MRIERFPHMLQLLLLQVNLRNEKERSGPDRWGKREKAGIKLMSKCRSNMPDKLNIAKLKLL